MQEIQDDDVDAIDLPSHCTKLGLCKQFVAKRGWKFHYNPKKQIIDRAPIGRMVQDPDNPSLPPSIKPFGSYWDEHFPKMKILSAAADNCNECFVFANQV